VPRLRRSLVNAAGLQRVRRGKRWCYRGADGSEVCDPEPISRIDALVIPPAWSEVWISPIRKHHVDVGRNGAVTFDYTAKHSKQRTQTVADDEVCAVVCALKRRRAGGEELLAYRGARGSWTDVRSPEINDYLRQLFGMECSAKDFRTWRYGPRDRRVPGNARSDRAGRAAPAHPPQGQATRKGRLEALVHNDFGPVPQKRTGPRSLLRRSAAVGRLVRTGQ
jgi:DNA topoisomerase IB